LISVSDSYFKNGGSGANHAPQPKHDPDAPKQLQMPSHSTMMDTSLSGSHSIPSGPSCVSIMDDNSGFDLLLSPSEKVYMLSWVWLPRPPVDDLLKVPISNS
jgi:hypothetical protein